MLNFVGVLVVCICVCFLGAGIMWVREIVTNGATAAINWFLVTEVLGFIAVALCFIGRALCFRS